MNTLTEKPSLLDDDIKLKTLNPCFEEHDYNFEQILENVGDLYHKYEQLQNFYYSMYIKSFVDSSFHKNALKLYNDFKGVCRLLTKIKNLVGHNLKLMCRLSSTTNTTKKDLWSQIKQLSGWTNSKAEIDDGDFKYNVPMLGSEEIKVLVNYNDIKIFLDRNNLYPIIDSNYYID